MLDLLGADYLIEHIVHAVNAERDRDQYRAYVTDALKIIADNTRNHVVYGKRGADVAEIGGTMKSLWSELARPARGRKPEPEPVEDTRTVEEIVDHIWGAIEGN